MDYKPEPIDTRGVPLSREISQLIELLAKNAHENWAKLRIEGGWRLGKDRDSDHKEHPNLVPYEQLSEEEKEFDRRSAVETIKALLAFGYAIRAPGNPSPSPSQPPINPELENLLESLREPGGMNVASARKLWQMRDPDAWSSYPDIYRLLSERALRLGEPLLGYDIAAEGVRSFLKDQRLRQLLALSLARSGAAGSANGILMALYEEGSRDEETLGLLARTHKDLASEAVDPAEANWHLCRAYEFYSRAYELTGGYWSGINAATLALFLGKPETATIFARAVREHCLQKMGSPENKNEVERYWLLSTLGEAALILGDFAEAEDWYGRAVEAGRGHWGNLRSTRHNARLLALHLEQDTSRVDRIFRFPNVALFVGPMIDQAGRQRPRFPPEIEQAVRNEIRIRLEEKNAGFGYASAACGSDILFHELMQERMGESHVILPYEQDLFARDSVDIVPGGNWLRRFESVIAHATDKQEISKRCHMSGNISYEFANRMLLGLASIRAQQLEASLIPIALCDSQSDSQLSGTAVTVDYWQKLGLRVELIHLDDILRRERSARTDFAVTSQPAVPSSADEPPSEFRAEIRALLFADAEGFSKLTDEEVPQFVRHFLGLVGELSDALEQKPLMKNTWGDGLYFVFANVQQAGRFALDLRDRVRSADWSSKSLPNLNLRIGLHAGPVFQCIDPVTHRPNFIGAQVSQAARIEPVTPVGQVYASQPFAALATAEGVSDFRCDYVGQTSMAKKYGVFPTYIVLRRTRTSASKTLVI